VRCLLLIIFFMLAMPQNAKAGPWLREKGTTFTSVSLTANYYLETASQTYLEYGLTEKMTLIANIGMARQHFLPESGYATFSLRRALSKPEAQSKWAYEFGVGVGWAGETRLPHVRTGISWGKGMTWGERSGWAVVEAEVVWDMTDQLHLAKLDGTVGMNFTDVTAGMLQIYTAHTALASTASIAPSLIFSPKNSKFRLQIGAEADVVQFDKTALKIGLWREF